MYTSCYKVSVKKVKVFQHSSFVQATLKMTICLVVIDGFQLISMSPHVDNCIDEFLSIAQPFIGFKFCRVLSIEFTIEL